MEIENNDILSNVASESTKQLAKDVYTDVVHPAAQNIGNALGIFTGWFSTVVLFPLKKINIEYEQKAIAWQHQMEKKYNNVPEENRVDPQLNITGPTLESLKYNIMDDDLADMFSNLLVSDMDSTTQGLCTPSFVKVIEQLTPNDAILFKKIFNMFIRQNPLPLCRIKYSQKRNSSMTLPYDLVPIFYTSIAIPQMDVFAISKSIQNLQRLGLIEIIEDVRYYKNALIYDEILKSAPVSGVINWAKEALNEEYEPSFLSRGYYQVNDFGKDFARVCLRDL